MSINSPADYASVLGTTTSTLDITTPVLSSRMKTEEFNSFFSSVQTSLETLYQKTRNLQDMNEYVKNKILEEGSKCYDKISAIENNVNAAVNSYLDKGYVLKTIDLSSIQSSSELLKDRDGKSIPSCIYNNGNIIMPATIKDIATVKNIVRQSDKECYDNNAEDLLKTAYRTVYKTQSTIELNGVTETLTIEFDNEIKCNFINIQNVNCKIVSIYGLTADGAEISINTSMGYIDPINIAAIKIIMFCDTYSTIVNNNSKQLNKSGSEKVGNYSTIKNAQEKIIQINSETYADSIKNSVEKYISNISEIKNINNVSNKISDIVHTENISEPDLNIETIISEEETTNYIYTFGIDNIAIENKEVSSAAACVFKTDIANCDKIEIEVDTNTEVEIYKIDNNKETPIRIVGKNTVSDEVIFYDKDTRFDIDNSSMSIIKKNGIVSNIDLADAKSLAGMNNDIYTISYKITEGSIGADNMAGIKIIMRYIDSIDKDIPYINRLAVRQYGDEVDWII